MYKSTKILKISFNNFVNMLCNSISKFEILLYFRIQLLLFFTSDKLYLSIG